LLKTPLPRQRPSLSAQMQQRVMLVILALSAAQMVSASMLSATSEARQFLRRHTASPPQQDELAELKGENPDAYALVKALLTKRSLGLLNPRHPTASFVPPSAAQQEQQQLAEQGPEVFTNMLRPGEMEASHVHQESLATSHVEVALPYASVAPQHHDWMNWKASDSAANDDQMVQNVLASVAELKGGKPAGLLSTRRQSDESSSPLDQLSVGEDSPPPQPKAAPAAPAPHENSYLKSIDFGIRAPEMPEKAEYTSYLTPKGNSYLKNFDLSDDTPSPAAKRTSQAQTSSADSLASFSWDDSAPKEQPKPKVAEPEIKSKDHSFLAWLGVEKQAPAPKAEPAVPAKRVNTYLMDLQ